MNLYKLLCLDVIIYFFFNVCLYHCTTIQSTRIPTRERMSKRDWRGERVTRERGERSTRDAKYERPTPYAFIYHLTFLLVQTFSG